jgi:predicted Zn-dependent protease
MPDMFARMGQRMAANPAAGFQGMLDDLASLEAPALEGVTLAPVEERQIGARAREEYLRRARLQGMVLQTDPEPLRYLQSLVDGLARHMRHRDRYPKIEVALLRADPPDGQSFPGGFLIFTTGLLDQPDEATVAAVVAHELAHLDLGHLHDYARRDKLAQATYSQPGFAGAGFDQFFTRQAALLGLMMNPFRPEHEHQADCLAATWLYQDGYDPLALVDFLEALHRRVRDVPANQNPFISFLRSHPYSLERRDHVRARLAQLQRWRRNPGLARYPENLARLQSRYAQAAAAAAAPAAPPP